MVVASLKARGLHVHGPCLVLDWMIQHILQSKAAANKQLLVDLIQDPCAMSDVPCCSTVDTMR